MKIASHEIPIPSQTLDQTWYHQKQYKKSRPWKTAKISRKRYEKIILNVPRELIEEHRREAETNAMMEAVFGKELAREL